MLNYFGNLLWFGNHLIFCNLNHFSNENKAFLVLQMDDELPLVGNIDEDVRAHGDAESDNQVNANIDVNNAEEHPLGGLPYQLNETNEQNIVIRDELQEANLDEPNLENQQLLIYLEGAQDYPIANLEENIAREERGIDNDDGSFGENDPALEGQQRPRILIRDINLINIDEEDSNDGDENDSEMDDSNNSDDEIIQYTSSSEDGDTENEDQEAEEREDFDTELPGQHQYMGESREIKGRIILEENLYVDIPVISQPGIILMPNQTLPMTFFQPAVISMMKRLVETTKTFGVIHKR